MRLPAGQLSSTRSRSSTTPEPLGPVQDAPTRCRAVGSGSGRGPGGVGPRQALFEYLPIETGPSGDGRVHRVIRYGPLLDVFVLDMRSYRDANSANAASATDSGILGAKQVAWLERELAASRATWKVIAADMPLALVVPDGADQEAIAQGDGGAPLGREGEIARVLSFIHRRRIANTVWLTADVHYTAAHYYDPDKAAFQDFTPFWEFVSGPLNAIVANQPNRLDGTFGPQVRFQSLAPDTCGTIRRTGTNTSARSTSTVRPRS